MFDVILNEPYVILIKVFLFCLTTIGLFLLIIGFDRTFLITYLDDLFPFEYNFRIIF